MINRPHSWLDVISCVCCYCRSYGSVRVRTLPGSVVNRLIPVFAFFATPATSSENGVTGVMMENSMIHSVRFLSARIENNTVTPAIAVTN